ncbi:MAG: YciI family protein [Aggregatilineales bacterium]
MKYIMLMYSNPSAGPQTEEEGEASAPKWYGLLQEGKKAGALVDNQGVMPESDATTVRIRDGKSVITDGPFAETHEQFGGYFVFECENLDEAIAWAEKIPTVEYGSIEIRPLYSHEDYQ